MYSTYQLKHIAVPKTLLLTTLLVLVSALLAGQDEIKETGEEHTFVVRNILFQGNSYLSDTELESGIRTRIGSIYDQSTAIDDASLISDIYREKGYPFVEISYPEAVPVSPEEVDVHFYVNELEQFQINRIIINGNAYISTERIEQETGINRINGLKLSDIDSYMVAIIELYASRGFLFAETHLDSVVVNNEHSANKTDIDTHNIINAVAYISIEEGKFSRFHNFIFEGNEVTNDDTIMRISGLDRMEVFSLSNLQAGEENVRAKDYIRDFSIIPINHETLLLITEEDKMTNMSGMIGYDNTRDNTSERITGFINLRLLNLYGTDRSLGFSWSRLRPERQSVELSYSESGPANLPIAGDIKLYRETVDSTYIMTSIDAEVFYYSLRNKIGLYLGSDDIFPGTRRPIIIDQRSYKKGGLFWRYNSLDHRLNPTQGMEFHVRHYYILHRYSGEWVNKQATEITWRHFIEIFRGNVDFRPLVFKISLNSDIIQDRDLQDYEYYSLGGINTIRGFRESQFDRGIRVFWSNFELRYLFERQSRFFIFIDYGYVEEQDRALSDLFGVGFGIRIQTMLGLIGVDYGFSHSTNTWMHPLDGLVHFGLETSF